MIQKKVTVHQPASIPRQKLDSMPQFCHFINSLPMLLAREVQQLPWIPAGRLCTDETHPQVMAPVALSALSQANCMCNPQAVLSRSRVGSVMGLFRQIIGMEPTARALVSLRKLFTVTGRITRNERRSRAAMVAAFESHAAEILMMQNQPLLFDVTRILLNDNHRTPDYESMYLSACSYFNFAPDWRKRH
jgi:hypothetical protein